MSIEVDPVEVEFRGTVYQVFPSFNEEFPDQLDSFRVVRKYDGTEIDQLHEPDDEDAQMYLRALMAKAKACARDRGGDLERNDDVVIDYTDEV